MRRPLLAVSTALFLSAPIATQGQFAEIVRGQVPRNDSDLVTSVATGDVDGDGDLDIALANLSGENRLYLNDGRGTYSDATGSHMPGSRAASQAVALGDVDGDGDLDIAIGGALFDSALYLNDGTGRFTDGSAGRMPAGTDKVLDLELADLDGDGDLDLALARGTGIGQQNLLLQNDGSGTFTDVTATQMPLVLGATYGVASADIDGDGDRDLAFANVAASATNPQNVLLVNDGTGTFTNVTATQLPGDQQNSRDLEFADLDGDGDQDLVIANSYGGATVEQNRFYQNDGFGTFTDVTAGRLPVDNDTSHAVAAGDADGDGDTDLLFGNSGSSTLGVDRLYLNDGAGVFTEAPTGNFPSNRDITRDVVLGDVDADGDLDAIIGTEGFTQRVRLYENDAAGAFADVSVRFRLPIDRVSTTGYAVGDLDGDGNPDLVLANDRAFNQVLPGDGTGVFARREPIRWADLTKAVALCDVENDGDLDVLFGNSGDQNRLYLNDGAGNLSDATARLPSDNRYSWDLAAGDLDGDGDDDLVFANLLERNSLYRNDGAGNFADVSAAMLPVTNGSRAMDLGDVDGDGDLDLVFVEINTQPILQLNDGRGFFTDASTQLPQGIAFGRDLILTDVDGDTDLDLVIAAQRAQNRLYLNDGTGHFTDATSRLPADTDDSIAVAAGDIDGDGDFDLAFANKDLGGQQNRLYLNDGAGTFTDATSRLPSAENKTLTVHLADLDRDGDLDLLTGNDAEQNALLVNLDSQVLPPRAPYLGGGWRLELYRQPGYGRSLWVALSSLQVNAAPYATPTPFGPLFLQAPHMLPLPWISIPPGTGAGVHVVAVPVDPVLAGSSVTVQALLIDLLGGEIRLSNHAVDVIEP